MSKKDTIAIDGILDEAQSIRWESGGGFHQAVTETIFADAARIADSVVDREGKTQRLTLDRQVDKLVTSKLFGFPLMVALFALVFWLTISGANVPSAMLFSLLVDKGVPFLKTLTAAMSFPWWLDGILIDGIYLSTGWVISVMLPPMAIFFPLFTLLEDLGYLPRVAFNLDNMFKKSGAHGKQALSMMMGFGCNAAGIISTRIIDSPRERLIAMITNNFSLCNGRWPTQILVATIFIGGVMPAHLSSAVSALAVVAIALLGVFFTFGFSYVLSKTLLKGEVSTFSLELPPYRPPQVWRTLYTSMIDRTLFVLWRAIVFAAPAGAIIWLTGNLMVGDVTLAEFIIHGIDPFAMVFGLNGVILLAYVVAIPANEIVIPTILMLTALMAGTAGAGSGVMFELDNWDTILQMFNAAGWTLLTGINLMLFSLAHNPCSTTIYTIYKETKSLKWTTVATIVPVVIGFVLTFITTQIWNIFVV
jgi:ferrous iron transport protein B